MSTRAEVEALLDLIRDSALKALDEYEKHGGSVPSLQSTETHPLDRSDNKLNLKKIIGTLEGACEQLCSTLASPTQTLLNRVQDYQWICLRVVVKHKIADELAKHEHGLHLNDLAKIVNIEPRKLGSILRTLATKHCFQEMSPSVFANNRLSLTLTATHPMSSAVLFSTDRHEYIYSLPEYLADPEFGHSIDVNHAPFQYFAQQREPHFETVSYYEWIERPRNQERQSVMADAMIAISEAIGGLSAVNVYDWKQVNTVCDVGAGIGHFSRALLQARSNVHVTLFDLPRTIENTRQHWGQDYLDRMLFAPGDFLQNIPVENCDVYYMRNVLHNWADEKAITILKNVHAAMGPTSRLLIHDPILRPLYSAEHCEIGLEQAQAPLLPNYGAGCIQSHNMNMTMLTLFNAKERYLSEITILAQTAGFRLTEVYDLSETCILELVPKQLIALT